MKSTQHTILSLFCLLVLGAGLALAQAPTGGITGTITDESGGVIPTAKITVTNKDTGISRTLGAQCVGPGLCNILKDGFFVSSVAFDRIY